MIDRSHHMGGDRPQHMGGGRPQHMGGGRPQHMGRGSTFTHAIQLEVHRYFSDFR